MMDHDVTDLMRPGASATTGLSLNVSDLQKEEVLTRGALITTAEAALCQESPVVLSTVPEGELEWFLAYKCAWYEDRLN